MARRRSLRERAEVPLSCIVASETNRVNFRHCLKVPFLTKKLSPIFFGGLVSVFFIRITLRLVGLMADNTTLWLSGCFWLEGPAIPRRREQLCSSI